MTLSHEQRRQRRVVILDRVRNGESVTALAAEYGLTENHIYTIARNGAARALNRRSMLLAKRKAQLAEFHALGQTQGAFIRLTGLVPTTVSYLARSMGLKFGKDSTAWAPVVAASKSRAEKMAALYRAGYTLAQIGQMHAITRERVRQLMTKHLGIRQQDGGEAKQVAIRAEKRAAAKNTMYLKRYGCGVGEIRALRAEYGSKPTYAFQQQRRNARERKIGWELTFWQWWCIWRDSGHWAQRGRGQGYVMCRRGDIGPYAVGNVFIATSIENVSTGKHKKSGLPVGVKQNKSGTFSACRTFGKKVYGLGTYPTPELAHAAYLMAAPQHQQAA